MVVLPQEGRLNTWLTRAVCVAGFMGASMAQGPLQAAPQEAARALTITPARLDFGSLAVGATSPVKTATVSNAGSSEVRIDAILTSGFDFSQTNTCGPSLAAGASCTIQVTFKPATSGPRLGTLNVFDSAQGSPHMIAIAGTGE